MTTLSSPATRAILLTAAIALAPFVLGSYGHFILASVLIYFLVALSLSVLLGMGGQISIGHAGFWALGAYGSALAVVKLGLPFPVAVLCGGLVAAVFGALVALPALRVQGHYLAIATLSFAVLVQQVLFEWESLTGGRQGLTVPRPEIAGFVFADDRHYVYILLVVAVACAWAVEQLRRSHTGRSLLMLKASPIAAQMAGIGRSRHIILAFSISAFLTGVSGALYAHLIGFLSTESFTLGASLAFLCMAVIGGLNSYVGALLGALYLSLAPEVFRELKDAQMIVYGVALVLCMRFLPDGLASLPAAWARLRAGRRGR
jgi:branched-chain amino acid transport system permease protein